MNLFAALLGPAFDALPPKVKALHQQALPTRLHGEVSITPGHSIWTRAIAWIGGLPTTSVHAPFHIDLEPTVDGERWTRAFPPRPFRSRFRARNGLLSESLGPAELRFLLHSNQDGIEWQLREVRLLGIRMPKAWFGEVQAREFEEKGLYRFQVSCRLPILGHLVAYDGWLDLARSA